MTDIDTITTEQAQEQVATLLRDTHGHDAYVWHSGGNHFGVRVDLPNAAYLFTSLSTTDAPEAPAWVGADLTDAEEGECIATLEVQVRPHDSTFAPADDPQTIATALDRLLGHLR